MLRHIPEAVLDPPTYPHKEDRLGDKKIMDGEVPVEQSFERSDRQQEHLYKVLVIGDFGVGTRIDLVSNRYYTDYMCM